MAEVEGPKPEDNHPIDPRPPAGRVPSGGLSLLAICIAVLLSLWAFAVPLVPKVNPAALVDLRRDRSQHDYSMVLAARTDGLGGHAYVVWVHHPQIGVYNAKGIGFYSKGDPTHVSTLFGGQGEVEAEFTRSSGQTPSPAHVLVVWVDRDQFEASHRILDRWQTPQRHYFLFQSDCITMLSDFVAALALRAPRRLLMLPPDRYVMALIEVNNEGWVRSTAALPGG